MEEDGSDVITGVISLAAAFCSDWSFFNDVFTDII